MAIQKTYLDKVLENSDRGNRWLDAAAQLGPLIKKLVEIDYTYMDAVATIECESRLGERFLIVFSWVNYKGADTLCISVKTYAPIINADILAHVYLDNECSSIAIAMSVGKLIATIENEVTSFYNNKFPKTPLVLTSIQMGTKTLETILKLLIGKVYHNTFNYDWPNNAENRRHDK